MNENESNRTRIVDVSFFKAVSPHSRPIADSTHQISEISFLVTRIRLANGVTGESYLLSFDYSPEAIAGALRDVQVFAHDFQAYETGRFIKEYEKETEYFGHSGIHRWAMGSINIAMWDAWGKHLKEPVHKLLGSVRSRVPLYGSGGWLSYSMKELLEEVKGYSDRGFKAVKIKVGSPDIESDVERLHRVRESVGKRINIMMDANQGMTVSEASELAERVRPLRISWFEEPISNKDYDGYQILRSRSGISLAMGEREFDLIALRELIGRKALDLWQPDILRLGSVEAWRESSAYAHAHSINVLPHYYKEYDVPLLTTIPNSFGAESFDWVDPIITNPIRMKDGWAFPNEEPGWGFEFKESALSEL